MAKEKEVSPVDTLGEEFGARFMGNKVVDKAKVPSTAQSANNIFYIIGAGWVVLGKLVGKLIGWHDVEFGETFHPFAKGGEK